MKSIVLNEGLEKLGIYKSKDSKRRNGLFSDTQIQQIVLPSTLIVLGDNAFY